jgi:peptide/nickel transport system substrate-binding protein
MQRVARHNRMIAAAAVIGAALIAGCSGSPSIPLTNSYSGAFGTIPAAATAAQHAGTVTWAEPPGAAPTWILPLVTALANGANNVNEFEYEMWRPLYWFGNGVEPTESAAMSLASPPAWSNGDKTVTITLKSSYKWSDGQPVSARDVLFWFDEVKAAIRESPVNWGPYTPGVGIPDQVASVTTRGASTVVFTLDKAVNPGWFTDDELPLVVPMPSAAWASAGGPVLDFTVPTNATKIYDRLAAASKSLSTYVTSPLWHTVDGPYVLTAFDPTSGAFTLTPNAAYGGPHARTMSSLRAVSFTSPTAGFDAVRAGGVDVGFIPLNDVTQVSAVRARGYNVFGYPPFQFNYVIYNFLDKTGHFNAVIAQLYMRQAIAHLEDQAGYIKAFFGGAGGPAYGPIPALPESPYVPADAVTDPYPFSVSAAIGLLKSHGWAVRPGGADVCARAGAGAGECGAGIPAGTKLAFNLFFGTLPPFVEEMVTDLASQAAKAGIMISLRPANYNFMITNYDNPLPSGKPNIDKWAMADLGGIIDPPYPTTVGIFNSTGSLNGGSYSDPVADKLIAASVASGGPAAVKAEASFLTANQPALFLPNPDWIAAWKKNLSGTPASFANLTQSNLTPEYWYFTS